MFDTKEDRKKMEEVVAHFKDDMKKVRTGRAHPDMLSGVKVEVYGQFMPLNQAANITAADATMLVVTPFDPSNLQTIAAAIRSDQALGLNPTDDGRIIRVPIPALTEERRKELVKGISKRAEDAKVVIRGVRRDAIEEFKALKKKSEITEDDLKTAENDIQKLTDQYVKDIDTIAGKKEKEIMEI